MDQPSSVYHHSAPAKKRRHYWIWAIILLLFGLLFYWAMQQHNQAAPAAGGRRSFSGPVPITSTTVTTGSIGIYLNAIGTVTPVYTDSVTAQVTGVITAVHYREGQFVKKGDPLIDIDSRIYEAQLAQAQGSLERDQNLLAEAQMDLERYKQAWAKNAIPRQTMEDQEKLVLQDQGTVKNDQGVVQYDQVQVSYCHITSPIDGHVGLRLVDPGNLVTANSTTTLVVVTQTQPITVIFTLAEDSLPQVLLQMHSKGAKPLEVDAYDRTQQNLLAKGKLSTVDNQIDTTTGTVKLRAQFDNSKGLLFPNQFVNTRLLVKTLDNQTLVPSSAIQRNGNVAFVYLVQKDDGKHPANGQSGAQGAGKGSKHGDGQKGEQKSAHGSGQKGEQTTAHTGYIVVVRNITTGISDHGQTVVQPSQKADEGLKAGDTVANSSFQKLQDGSQVFESQAKLQPSSDDEETAP